MAEDFRVKTSWRASGKRRRLWAMLGPEAVIAVEDLWAYCTAERPSGDLSGLTNAEIAGETLWAGDPDELVAALVALRLLDGELGHYRIHDWHEHQPHASGEVSESNRARAHARWHNEGKHAAAVDGCPLCAGNAPAMRPHAPALPPAMPIHPSIHPSIHPERDDARDGVILKPHEVEATGYPKYGALAGKGLVAIRKLGDIAAHELADAMATEGKSWVYAARVIASMRDEANRPAPPGSARSRAGPGSERQKRVSTFDPQAAVAEFEAIHGPGSAKL